MNLRRTVRHRRSLPRRLPLRTSLNTIFISFDCPEDSIERTRDRGLLSDALEDIGHAVLLPDVRGSLKIPMSSGTLNGDTTLELALSKCNFALTLAWTTCEGV